MIGTRHWEGTPEGKCLRKDLDADVLAADSSRVTCEICLHAMGRRNKNHLFAVFMDEDFQSSHVTKLGAERALVVVQCMRGWHVRKWQTETQQWVRL